MTKLPFKYDVIKLIENVRERPCLWDKTLETYKDRIERRNAWEEIFHALEDTYEQMSWEERRSTGELILNKWTNIRDTFVRSLKTRIAGKPKRKYLFHDQLYFLTKVTGEEDSNITIEMNNELPVYMKQEPATEKTVRRKTAETEYVERVPKKQRKQSSDSDYNTYETPDTNISFVGVEPEINSRLMNEDEAFFASLLPTVVKYNEDERLEFRMDVLSVMKKIKDKRNWHTDE